MSSHETLPAHDADSDEATTRDRVARSILEQGPSTAAELAERLALTPAAVRRHLAALIDSGHLEARDQRVYGQRGRGRPAKVFCLTDAGRSDFYQAYDRLAISALEFLRAEGGEQAVTAFADQVMEEVRRRFTAEGADYASPADALAEVLNEQGYVATLKPVASGTQLCQYHCPVAHVARAFPELCAAETRVFSELLGSHVQRLATIAHGDGVCTTHIPHPVERTS
ncbi:MAG TPA: transcriptional regulator [Propioniciclava sp.]|jgi:predicted ArsR family transcriptional regulator|uniref:helix-turn-helix transcriptional regulator n=1 Tax=Propioniciclava sp. TaxID=2038686 RepID=UPI002BB2B81A|nr:metalloregulator ArsR/SmtB family transcription factor [Propioniciclava sp.]HRL48620.1 transcriptional regulator [Propioniciclava sp.]HRL80542.1 transcriptional regulator [Propioniciclava sp.]